MPTNGEAIEDRKSVVIPRQPDGCLESKYVRQDSKRKDFPVEGGGGGEQRRLGQFLETSRLKNSGLFGFVQYFMERPDASSPSSGTSSPSPAGSTTTTTIVQLPAADSPSSRSCQPNSNSPGHDAEPVKNEVFGDGNKSDKSDGLRNDLLLALPPSQNSRVYLKSEEYRQLFHLPPEEVLVEDFNCALQKKILLQGHMYLFERYVCFYSNIFGYEKKKVIPLKDITSVRKAKTAGVFPNAIETTSWGKKHFFASFLSRDEAYRLIINGWSQHSGYARIFLGSHYSPMSSPPSQGRMSLDSASWQSPRRSTNVQPEEADTPRSMEEVRNLVAPSIEEVRDADSVEGAAEPGDSENSAEGTTDERLSVNGSSSMSTASISPLWQPEDADAPGLPESYKTVVESEFAIDVEEFFQLFFSDDAIAFNKRFHSKCGDDDFRCSQWAKHRHFGHARDISFRHPINIYFGPKSTYCHESQRFRIYRNSHLVLEASQQLTDIPYGDYFHVEVRWDVERLCGKGRYHSFARVSLGVSFCKKTVWKGKIEQGTLDESKEAYTTWICEAHLLLRTIRSLTLQSGTVENTSTAPTPPTDQNVKEGSCQDDANFPEAEQPLLQKDEEPAVLVLDDVQKSRVRVALHGIHWRKRGSALVDTLVLISQKIWNKSRNNEDSHPNRQLKLLCFVLIAVIIVLMQVGIMIALTRSSKVHYVPVGYVDSYMPSGSCVGESFKGNEALAWLEQRAQHVKDEIILAEAQLETLHHDLALLKTHASRLLNYVDHRTNSQLNFTK